MTRSRPRIGPETDGIHVYRADLDASQIVGNAVSEKGVCLPGWWTFAKGYFYAWSSSYNVLFNIVRHSHSLEANFARPVVLISNCWKSHSDNRENIIACNSTVVRWPGENTSINRILLELIPCWFLGATQTDLFYLKSFKLSAFSYCLGVHSNWIYKTGSPKLKCLSSVASPHTFFVSNSVHNVLLYCNVCDRLC